MNLQVGMSHDDPGSARLDWEHSQDRPRTKRLKPHILQCSRAHTHTP